MSPLFREEQAVELFECIAARPDPFATPEHQDEFSAARSKRIEQLYRLIRTDPNVTEHPQREAKRVARLLWKHTQRLGEGRDRVVQIFLRDVKASEDIAVENCVYPKVKFYRGLHGFYDRLSTGRM